MKKLLVVLLALTFVVAMATAALAVTTTSVDGKVEWTYKDSEQFGGSVDGKVIFDLGKDFGEGYTAGLKVKIDPTNDNNSDELKFDGDGWIKMAKEFGNFTFQTGGLGGNAANDLGKGYDMSGNAGMQFDSTTLVDGLSLTVVLNDNLITVADPNAGETLSYLNYLLKGVYTKDALTLGAGYQAHTQPASATDSAANDMYAVWAGYKLGESLNFGLEYAGRPNSDGVVGTGADAETVEGSSGIMVKADYTLGALTLNGKAQIQTGRFFNMDPDDIGTTSAFNFFQYGYDLVVGKNDDPKDGTGIAGTAIKFDAKYQITEALSATVTVEDILAGATVPATSMKANPAFNPLLPIDPITNPEQIVNVEGGSDLVDDMLMSYKLAVTDVMNEKLTLDGWYAGYGKLSEIGLKGTYTFVAGLVGSLELKSTATEGSDPANTYTATIKATL